MKKLYIISAITFLFSASAYSDNAITIKRDYTYKPGNGFVEILKNNVSAGKYMYNLTFKPYIYPLNTPAGICITSNDILLRKIVQTPYTTDSFWLGDCTVNGIDFSSDSSKSGKIIQKSLTFDSIQPGYWNIHVVNDWLDSKDKKILEEERRYSFSTLNNGMLVSVAIILKATGPDLKIVKASNGFFNMNLNSQLALSQNKGQVRNSRNDLDMACNNKTARWCNWFGEIDNKKCGVAIFDISTNHGYPSKWLIENNGKISIDPFYISDSKSDKYGELKIPAGGFEFFVYAALAYDGEISRDKLDNIAEFISLPK